MNALMRLNQIRPGLQYRLLSQSGPVHAPVFTMSVDLDGSVYEASGSSKKTAKLHVAVKVRDAVIPPPCPPCGHWRYCSQDSRVGSQCLGGFY